VALLIEPALETSEEQSTACTELRPVDAQPAPGSFGMRSRRDCQLDRISNGIYERAVRLQLGELQHLVRLSMARELRPEPADLNEQIKADILSLSVE